MIVAGVQSDLVWEAPQRNMQELQPQIEAAAAAGARLVALPEMWPTGFTMRPESQAEPEGGPAETFMLDCARRTGAAVCGSLAQTRPGGGRARNVFVFARPDGRLDRVAKVHPFTLGGEAAKYDAGDAALTVEFEGVRITPFVCYDVRFPELWAPRAPGTDLFVLVANWPAVRAAHWRALVVARAIETQAYVLAVNRVGDGGGFAHAGDSALVSPLGELLADAWSEPGRAACVAGEVDPAVVRDVRARLPFLADRRPALYRRLGGG